MRVADTSALYAVFDEADAHHERALRDIADDEAILIPSEIVGETMGLLQLRLGSRIAREAMESFHKLPHVEIQPTPDDVWDNILQHAMDTYSKGEGPLSYRDQIVVSWCQKRKLKPWSFDKRIIAALS